MTKIKRYGSKTEKEYPMMNRLFLFITVVTFFFLFGCTASSPTSSWEEKCRQSCLAQCEFKTGSTQSIDFKQKCQELCWAKKCRQETLEEFLDKQPTRKLDTSVWK